MTVLIALISFVGYIAVRLVGYARGVAAAGLAGGLASSTATTAALARLAALHPERVDTLAGGATLANAVMSARAMVHEHRRRVCRRHGFDRCGALGRRTHVAR